MFGIEPVALKLICKVGDRFLEWRSRGSITLGRSPENTLAFSDRKISRVHARIESLGRNYRIADLESANGIKVNGQKVRSYTLERGDEIEIGDVRLFVV